jgi:acyl-CoA reductase-like NAD-dependent aldehyde dehydrogenase
MARQFTSVDPRTGHRGATFVEATPDQVAAAAAEAGSVHRSGALRDRAARTALLRRAAGRLRAAGDEIVAVATTETGLPDARLRGELERTSMQLEEFAHAVEAGKEAEAIIDAADPTARPVPRPDVRRMLIPIGPVAVFGASNFPLAFSTAGGDTASVLAAGCPAVVKGHPSHPGTGVVVAREVAAAVEEVGLPPGTFRALTAAGTEVGEALVDAPEIQAVAFTGSYRGGKAIHDRAARRPVPIPVYAEMGSLNPVVITEAGLATHGDEIAEGLSASVSNFAGQLCTKPGLVFVPKGAEGDKLAGALAGLLDAQEPGVLLNEQVRDSLRHGVERLARRPEACRLSRSRQADGPGFRYQPAVYEAPAEAIATTPEMREEHFGPVVVLARYGSREELLTAIESLDGQLTGTIHADVGDDIEEIATALASHAGRIVFGGYPTGVSVTYAMHHGGPFPATSNPLHTSVGVTAARRFLRPVAFQDAPAALLPPELRDENPLGIERRINGEISGAVL